MCIRDSDVVAVTAVVGAAVVVAVDVVVTAFVVDVVTAAVVSPIVASSHRWRWPKAEGRRYAGGRA
eukprot:7405761-Pyramimonas_sp.AAC.1